MRCFWSFCNQEGVDIAPPISNLHFCGCSHQNFCFFSPIQATFTPLTQWWEPCGGGVSHHLTVVSQLINEHMNLQWLCGVISITNKGAKWMVLFISHIYRRWWQPYTDTKMWMHFYKNNSMLCNWWIDVSQSTAELLQLRVHWQGLSVNVVMLRCRVETRHFLISLSSESSLKMTGRIQQTSKKNKKVCAANQS